MWALRAVLSAPGVAVAAADATTNGGLDLTNIITAGVTPAVVLLLMMTGKLYPSGIVDSYKARATAAESEAAKAREAADLLSGQMMERVVPLLTLATQALDRLAPMLTDEAQHARTRYDDPPPRPAPRRLGG